LELATVVADELFGILAHDEHLPDVGLGLGVHLEAILIAHLALANLAVPSQPLKSLGLELVIQVFRRSHFSFWHLACDCLDVKEEDVGCWLRARSQNVKARLVALVSADARPQMDAHYYS